MIEKLSVAQENIARETAAISESLIGLTHQNYIEGFEDFVSPTGLFSGGWATKQSAAGMYNTVDISDYTGINAWGLVKINLKTTSTNKFYVDTGTKATSTVLSGGVLGAGEMRTKFRFGVVTLSDVTNTFIIRAGIQSHNQQEPDHGCFFRYGYDVNGGKWQAVCRSATVETAQDTGVLVVASSTDLHTFEVVVNAAGTEAKFYINGTLTNTITTNIPAAPTQQIGGALTIIRSAGTTDLIYAALIDYVYFKRSFSTPRP